MDYAKVYKPYFDQFLTRLNQIMVTQLPKSTRQLPDVVIDSKYAGVYHGGAGVSAHLSGSTSSSSAGASADEPVSKHRLDFHTVAEAALSHGSNILRPLLQGAVNYNGLNATFFKRGPSINADSQVIFIFAGRQIDARIPKQTSNTPRRILVLTREEWNKSQTTYACCDCDYLVIDSLQPNGKHIRPDSITGRRLAQQLFTASLPTLPKTIMTIDDNIEAIEVASEQLSTMAAFYDHCMTVSGDNHAFIVGLRSHSTQGTHLRHKHSDRLTVPKLQFIHLSALFQCVKALIPNVGDLSQDEIARRALCSTLPADDSVCGEDIFFQVMVAEIARRQEQRVTGIECLDPRLFLLHRSKHQRNLARNEGGIVVKPAPMATWFSSLDELKKTAPIFYEVVITALTHFNRGVDRSLALGERAEEKWREASTPAALTQAMHRLFPHAVRAQPFLPLTMEPSGNLHEYIARCSREGGLQGATALGQAKALFPHQRAALARLLELYRTYALTACAGAQYICRCRYLSLSA